MLHRHELSQISLVECPRVNHLLAMSIDNLDMLTTPDKGSPTASRRNSLRVICRHYLNLAFIIDEV